MICRRREGQGQRVPASDPRWPTGKSGDSRGAQGTAAQGDQQLTDSVCASRGSSPGRSACLLEPSRWRLSPVQVTGKSNSVGRRVLEHALHTVAWSRDDRCSDTQNDLLKSPIHPCSRTDQTYQNRVSRNSHQDSTVQAFRLVQWTPTSPALPLALPAFYRNQSERLSQLIDETSHITKALG